MNKAKNITLCAVCAALSVIAMAAMAIPGVKWFVLILAVVASVAIALPMLESAAASEELSSQAATLKSLVGGFKF